MPRATVSGDERVAQRVRVLAYMQANPSASARSAERELGIPEATIRSIVKRWTASDLAAGDLKGKSSGGRPILKPNRWRRCAFCI